MRIANISIIIVSSLVGTAAIAEDARYVVDRADFAVRAGKSYKHQSVTSVTNGEAVIVLETDVQAGWSRIRTTSGSDGWIQSKYLTDHPPSATPGDSLSAQLDRLRAENQRLLNELKDSAQQSTSTAAISPPPSTPSVQPTQDESTTTPSAASAGNNCVTPTLVGALQQTEPVACDATNSAPLVQDTRRNWFLAGAMVTLAGAFLGRLLAGTRWGRD